MQHESIETRSYRILGVLGKGGFGKVYRARLEGSSGFSKDVAIKLLTEADPGDDVLNRFRDESRILGLLRDRALVTVDPPAQLNGRWAIIMECVDGVSARRLLKATGPLPVPIALEIIQEVARALDHAYTTMGPEGEPLELVHRDLKPDNLQITPQGQVKILDFGTARARFGAREAETTRSIAGTYGYIAPERLLGVDTAAGDIYSLGMVLHRLLTAARAEPIKLTEAIKATKDSDPTRHAALLLAKRMAADDPEMRPNAREVEDACQEQRREVREPVLRHWAPRVVAPLQSLGKDEMVGRTLSSTFHIQSTEITASQSRNRLMLAAAALGVNVAAVVAILVVLLVGLGAIGLVLYANAQQPIAVAPAVPATPAPEVRDVVPDPVPTPGPVPAPNPIPPKDSPPKPQPTPKPAQPAQPVAPRPAPQPAEPVVAPAAPQTYTIMVNSNPMGTNIVLDNRPVGKTPVRALVVSPGTHDLQLRLESGTVRETITIGPGKPNTFVWTGNSWYITTKARN